MTLAEDARTAHTAVWNQHSLILQCSSHAAHYIDEYIKDELKAGTTQHTAVLTNCRSEVSTIVRHFADHYDQVQPCALRFGDIESGALGGTELDEFVHGAGVLMGQVTAAVNASKSCIARAWGFFCAVQSDHRQLKKADRQLRYVKNKLPVMGALAAEADAARKAFYAGLAR